MSNFKAAAVCFIFYFLMGISTGLAADTRSQYVISGQAMGTFYTIKFISTKKESLSLWKTRVDTRLKKVDQTFSMFNPKSELSLFNEKTPGKPIVVSPDFYSILLTAQNLYRLTGGSWDGTVKPLVDLWGFGIEQRPPGIPESGRIAKALTKTGFNHIEIKESHRVNKKKDVTLDLGSIAKGYGVDAVAALFIDSGIRDILVEIGGELLARGKNKKGQHWRVGISRPDKHYLNQEIYKIIRLNNKALATSGNYRNFFEMGKKTFSHIIDPKTGFPVNNTIVSASVISKDCTFADGLATALMIMDVQKGIDLVNSLSETECLIIRKINKKLISHTSENFNDFLVK